MDARHFDALTRVLSIPDSRRRLLALLATWPLLGGLLGILDPEDAAAKERRRRRKQRHKRRKHPGGRKKGCKPKSKATLCAGRCGPVKSRQTCGKTVDCGPCDCSPACEPCFTCQGAAGAPGVCVPQAAGTPCGAAQTCAAGTVTPHQACDGSGACVTPAPVSCDPYTGCDGNACATSCAGDGDCVAGSWCEAGQCVGDLPNGQVCVQAGQCASGFCIENICCNSVCDGDCESCAIPGALGTCTTEDNFTPCGSGNVCCDGSCQECCTNGECANPKPICNAGDCIACATDAECGADQVCCSGSCFAGICCEDAECAPTGNACVENQCQCGSGSVCSGGTPDCCGSPGSCTNTETDSANCGACGSPCGDGLTCCDGGCVDEQTDPEHCGGCGNACDAGLACQGGVCGVVCGSDFCPAATAICVEGSCQDCDVTCTGSAVACGTALQTALAGSTPTLYVCPGRYRGGFTINRNVTVVGAGEGEDPSRDTILDGGGAQRVARITGGTVTLRRLHITGGAGGDGGGLLHQGSSLTMEDCTVAGNRGRIGGGVAALATLAMTRCTVRDNATPFTGGQEVAGGGIALADPTTLTDCLIADNTTDGDGGGIFIGAAPTILAGTTVIRGNTAGETGGGISSGLDVGSLTIGEACRITGNTAPDGQGGGIYHSGSGTVILQGTTDPSPIVVDNCHENCVGNVPKCAAEPVSCPA